MLQVVGILLQFVWALRLAPFCRTSGGTAKIVVDVGGGTGTLLAAILAKHPSLHGILFDQEQVILTFSRQARSQPSLQHLKS